MQVIGLTGSIAMGKSHAARMFKRFGIPVFDSDAAVHALFTPKTQLTNAIAKSFGDVLATNGSVDRQKLGAIVLKDPDALRQLEQLVHPAVHQAQKSFLKTACRQGFQRCVLDIPLLLEGQNQHHFDAIIVVACHQTIQRGRALARKGMSRAKFDAIQAKQMPTTRKLKAADHVISSGYDRGQTHLQIAQILGKLEQQPAQAWPKNW